MLRTGPRRSDSLLSHHKWTRSRAGYMRLDTFRPGNMAIAMPLNFFGDHLDPIFCCSVICYVVKYPGSDSNKRAQQLQLCWLKGASEYLLLWRARQVACYSVELR